MVNFIQIQSPLGPLKLVANERVLVGLHFATSCHPGSEAGVTNTVLSDAQQQLTEYFNGHRKVFNLPLQFEGTDFQKRVWRALLEIPFGETRSYADIAKTIGSPKAVRAVGLANKRNPIAIIAPCHRVIGSNGKLTGYAGGLHNKEWLLKHEQS